MSPITILIVIVCYFVLLLCIGKLAARKGGSSSFFDGGRRMPWGVVAFATLGAAISGVTFISVPGMVVNKGYSYLQMVIGFVAGYAIIGSVLLPLFYKRNLVSIYGYLEQRFGRPVYKTGAGFFFISKLLGAAVRFYVVCAVLQILVFEPLDMAFEVNVALTVALIWLYTAGGGVRSVIWTDVLKSFCLIASVVVSIGFIASELGYGVADTVHSVTTHPSSRIFFFDNPMEATYFWKQFIAGVFMAIAMNGLDQDMMQRHLACRDWRASRKNMLTGAIVQVGVIALFLVLGTLLMLYAEQTGLNIPDKTDELFGMIATSETMPAILGIMFVIGLIAAAYSAAASALTSLTTSFTIDILEADRKGTNKAKRLDITRKWVHIAMATAMGLTIVVFYYLSSDDAISAVYTLASYTYGPLLGLFIYGLASGHRPNPLAASAVCVASPIISFIIVLLLERTGYQTGFELLLINAALTCGGLALCGAVARLLSFQSIVNPAK